MPLVFIHGVNNRRADPGYSEGVARTDAFLKRIFASGLKPQVGALTTFYPYWGDDGVRFRWNQASLPKQADATEALSAVTGSVDRELWRADVARRLGGTVDLHEATKEFGFEAVVDVIFDTASLSGGLAGTPDDLAVAYLAAQAYAQANPVPAWTKPPQDNDTYLANFKRELAKTSRPAGAAEALGLTDVWDDIKESTRRFLNSGSDALTEAGVALARKKVQTVAGLFLGDIFVYLDKRGTPEQPGAIVRAVLNDLDAAVAAKTPGDDKLIVMSHSLGGIVMYDILTYFRPDLRLDLWLTVGSQVALFEEMKLYRTSDDSIPPNPPIGRVPKPANAKRWLNVFDTNDVFSYRAEPVFADVKDFKYDTGFGVESAHGGYFAQPSFYHRLAARLAT